MANNLFIAYDLNSPGQNYQAVYDAITRLGPAIRLQDSLFYVKTVASPDSAYAIVFAAMDAGDRLAVIEPRNTIVPPDQLPPLQRLTG